MPRLSIPYRHASFWIVLYFAIQTIIRIAISNSLGFDESEQAYFSQWWLVGYNGQPPLYTWIIKPWIDLGLPAVAVLAITKNCFLCSLYLSVHRLMRSLGASEMLAAVGSIGMLLIPQIGWESQRTLTHTVATTAIAALLLEAIERIRQRPERSHYLALAFVVAAGMLMKYNFAIWVLGLFAAAMTVKDYRRRLLSWKMLLAVIVTGIFLAPHGIWVYRNQQVASFRAVEGLEPSQEGAVGGSTLLLGLQLVGQLVLPPLVLLIIAYRNQILEQWKRRASDANVASPSIDRHVAAWRTLILRTWIIVALFLSGIVLIGNAGHFHARWLQPYLFIFPAWIAFAVRGVAINQHSRRWITMGDRRFAITAGIVATTIIAFTILRPVMAAQRGRYTWLNVRFDHLAHQIDDQIDERTLVVTDNLRTAGNLRNQFPKAQVLATHDMIRRVEILEWIKQLESARDNLGTSSSSHGKAGKIVFIVDTRESNKHQASTKHQASPREPSSLALQSLLGLQMKDEPNWNVVEVPFRYGTPSDRSPFCFGQTRSSTTRIATNPR